MAGICGPSGRLRLISVRSIFPAPPTGAVVTVVVRAVPETLALTFLETPPPPRRKFLLTAQIDC